MNEGFNMDAKNCLKKMQLVGVLNLATVDENGAPQNNCLHCGACFGNCPIGAIERL